MRQCSFDSCTYSITGRCIRGTPESECPHLQETHDFEDSTSLTEELVEGDWQRPQEGSVAGDAVLRPTEEIPRLPSSMTLGREEAQELMCSEATTMVGIVGLPGSGKTACLVSAYLLLSRGSLRGYDYGDSRSLMAFEQISRGSRQWASTESQRQLTVRTELADDRRAGFLHFKLRRATDGRLLNILLPDLPGEWSTSLIDKADSERFEFIKSATAMWIMVDGREFVAAKSRNYAIHRTRLLITRLAEIGTPSHIRLILVPSWRDIGEFPQTAFDQIEAGATSLGFRLILSPIASFSGNNLVKPGEGVADLFDITLSHGRECPAFWPDDQRCKLRKLSGFRSL
ncbi:TRAFAC clade GTPase domain-containing protein [Pseudomonas syringae]|uniref:TRAFAC clade GTPase domain-containing protein n=1 Tax=Pseudomonas syringae TaxID=317 RepID=UPI003D15BE50